MKSCWVVLLAVLLLSAPAGFAQKKKKDPTTRSVTGTVTTTADAAVSGAMVQLKDTKTKVVRSFYTQENGTYYFQGLSPDIEYELIASYQGSSSPTKTLSIFDSRKEAVINLKLSAKKEEKQR